MIHRWAFTAQHPRSRRGRVLPGVVAAALVALASGCASASSDAEDQPNQWPPQVPEVELTMQDGGFDFDTPVPSGRVVFRVHNAGSVTHRVTLAPLPEDMPPIDEQLHSDNRRGVSPVGATNPRQPGGEGVFAVDLEEGRRYAFICYEKDDEGTVHARKGENAELRAGGPDADPAVD